MLKIMISLFVLMFVLALAAFPQTSAPALPKLQSPSGSLGVGRVAYDWTDPERTADNADPSGPKESASMMVYIWYPTDAPRKEVEGVLLPGAREIDAALDLVPGFKNGPIFGGNWPLVVSGSITSHASEDAKISTSFFAFPIVIFSPGAFGTSFEYTGLIEDLVSHGYVVASIEHTYETFAVAFPSGKVAAPPFQRIQSTYLAPRGAAADESEAKLNAWNRRRVNFRAADISFALDKLSELNRSSKLSSQLSGRLDLSHVAAVGHSRGGWSAILACRRDKRLRACVNLDGSAGGEGLDYPDAPAPTQPILYVEVPKTVDVPKDWPPLSRLHLTPQEWLSQWHATVRNRLKSFTGGGDFVILTAPEMDHYSFSDRFILLSQKAGSMTTEATAVRNLRLAEQVTETFLDRYLKDDKHAVLRTSSEATVEHF